MAGVAIMPILNESIALQSPFPIWYVNVMEVFSGKFLG